MSIHTIFFSPTKGHILELTAFCHWCDSVSLTDSFSSYGSSNSFCSCNFLKIYFQLLLQVLKTVAAT